MALEFLGQDYDRPLTDADKAFLRSWNQDALLQAHEDKYGSDSVEGDANPADDYDSWKFKELKAEADSREPKVDYGSNPSGATLIQALRAWDAKYPEAVVE